MFNKLRSSNVCMECGRVQSHVIARVLRFGSTVESFCVFLHACIVMRANYFSKSHADVTRHAVLFVIRGHVLRSQVTSSDLRICVES